MLHSTFNYFALVSLRVGRVSIRWSLLISYLKNYILRLPRMRGCRDADETPVGFWTRGFKIGPTFPILRWEKLKLLVG